ncbi:MAG: glycosyltransferase family 2 protein [Akkermansia sp.]|nr:glycosyltransferase family 2 protein [Akkermansia sp.]
MKQEIFNPLVSVIVPIYNVALYLDDCLTSICNQTYKKLEIICVDDGSTDDSGKIIDKYAEMDERIKIIRQKNAGLSAARNAALDVAVGEWVIGVDSDDYLSVNAIENCIPHTADEDVDMIRFNVWDFADGFPEKRLGNAYFNPIATGKYKVTEALLQRTNVSFWGKLWRRSLLESLKLRFPLGLINEDLYFWYCMMSHSKYMYFENNEKALYYYRRGRVGSIMEQVYKRTDKKTLNLLVICDLILEWYKGHNIRQRFGYEMETPSQAEISLVEYVYRCMLRDCPPALADEAWFIWKNMIDKHALRIQILQNPWTAQHYFMPPAVVSAMNHFYEKKEAPKTTTSPTTTVIMKSDIEMLSKVRLLSSYNRLLRYYRLAQLKTFFSWGEHRKKNKEKKACLKKMIRRCRDIKMEFWYQLFN